MIEQPDMVNTGIERWLEEVLPSIEDKSGVQAFDLVYGSFARHLDEATLARASM
jgi:hypothetical protein